MKKRLLFAAILFTAMVCQAQDACDSFSLLKEGAFFEYTDYDKKGKPQSQSNHTTSEISSDHGTHTAIVKFEVVDVKSGENTYTNEYGVSCQNGIMTIDMIRFFNTDQLSQFGENMEVQVDGNTLSFPFNASVGEQLDDGYITIKVSSEGVHFITMTTNITNRKIAAEETITTAAGTFECKKMVYDFDSKAGFIKVIGLAEQWFTKDYVMVQSVTKNKKGKVLSTTKLTNISPQP